MIRLIENTVINGGLFAVAMPRGAGKTTLTVTAAIWALLYSHSRWVCLVGSTGSKAQSLLKAIKTELRFNALTLEDFPEVCVPIKALEGKAARAAGQTFGGKETAIEWLADTITLPTIEGSIASGSVVTVCGITGDIRGQQRTLASGEVIRPDYVILDDPQTRESAKSRSQTDDRIATLNGDILGLAGPGVKIKGVMPCTVISRGDMADQALDREESPEWRGKRTQLLYGMPKNMALWDKYQEIREAEFRNDGDGSQSLEHYKANQAKMDEGCRAAWDERHTEDEASGIQHAMNLFFRDEAAFWAEFQNEPLESSEDDTLTEDEITQRISQLPRSVLPDGVDKVTAFIDVQKNAPYYVVCAWKENFQGWVVEYGSWPDQKTVNFRYKQIKKTIEKCFPGQSLEVQLKLALDDCVNDLCGRLWTDEEGGEHGISRLLIDANWGLSRNIVYDFCRESDYRTVLRPSHGRFVGASTEPMNARQSRKGKTVGMHWRTERAKDKPNRYVLYDTNFWKSWFFSRMATEPGTAGSLTLYQARPGEHQSISKQMKSEYPVRTQGRGREVEEWKHKPDRMTTKLLPVVGVLWEPDKHSRYDITFPYPRLSRYWGTFGNKDVWWYVGGEYGGGNWTIKRYDFMAMDNVNDRIDINDYRVFVGLESTQVNRSVAFLEIGHVWNRKIVYDSTLPDLDVDATLMLRSGFKF